MNKRLPAVSTGTLEKLLKAMNSTISHILKVNSGHMEQNTIWIKLIAYLYYNTYWNQQKKTIFLQRFFNSQKDFLHTPYAPPTTHV